MQQPLAEITVRIAEAVSAALNVPIEDLPPLSQAIDLEAVEAIVTGDPDHDVTVTFAYAGLRVLVHSRRTVYVRPINDERGRPVERSLR